MEPCKEPSKIAIIHKEFIQRGWVFVMIRTRPAGDQVAELTVSLKCDYDMCDLLGLVCVLFFAKVAVHHQVADWGCYTPSTYVVHFGIFSRADSSADHA